MCATCGCGNEAGVRVFGPGHLGPGEEPAHQHEHNGGHAEGHEHSHEPGHEHGHEHGPAGRTIELQQKILAKNDRLAEDNRAWLTARGILAVNLMSSPDPARRRCWSAPRGTPAPAWAWP